MDEQQTQPAPSAKKPIVPVIAAVIIVAVLGIVGFTFTKGKTEPAKSDSPSPTAAAMQQATTAPAQAATTSFKDGQYTAVGNYTSPGGAEEIGVTLTLKDGKIADISVEPKATRPISKVRQQAFADNYKPLVMGKDISEVKLDKVGGSSLTPKGFNDAIQQIMTQAKA
jgi:uncharacterized protein with FMN-binding domain